MYHISLCDSDTDDGEEDEESPAVTAHQPCGDADRDYAERKRNGRFIKDVCRWKIDILDATGGARSLLVPSHTWELSAASPSRMIQVYEDTAAGLVRVHAVLKCNARRVIDMCSDFSHHTRSRWDPCVRHCGFLESYATNSEPLWLVSYIADVPRAGLMGITGATQQAEMLAITRVTHDEHTDRHAFIAAACTDHPRFTFAPGTQLPCDTLRIHLEATQLSDIRSKCSVVCYMDVRVARRGLHGDAVVDFFQHVESIAAYTDLYNAIYGNWTCAKCKTSNSARDTECRSCSAEHVRL